MAPFVESPDAFALLPPFLACLPTAFCSPRPPPALLPLLSPILRQRVQLLSQPSDPSHGSWLPLLCWEPTEAAELVTKIGTAADFEPHPVSGEIELGDTGTPCYRRKDDQTFQALLKAPSLGLMVIYLWCQNDEVGGGTGWRVSELRLFGSTGDYSPAWVDSIQLAEMQFTESNTGSLAKNDHQESATGPTMQSGQEKDADEDDYWARYDTTPGRTPGVERSPAPSSGASNAQDSSEIDYYARYADVQPQMDNHDATSHPYRTTESTLHGNEFIYNNQQLENQGRALATTNDGNTIDNNNLVHTRPSSSHSTSAAAQMERLAQNQPQSEIAIQQHIGTSIKSLHRLASGGGIDTVEFKRLVRTELDLLDLIDE